MNKTVTYVLNVLKDYSYENHYLTQSEIIKYLQDDYNITVDRRTVSSAIKTLETLDYDIIQGERNGVMLGERILDEIELKYLSDAIYSSKAIKSSQAEKIVKELALQLPKAKRGNIIHTKYAKSKTNVYSHDFFYTLDCINRAMNHKGKKYIEFKYLTYNKEGKEDFESNIPIKVVPLYTVCDNGKHYLICGKTSYNGTSSIQNYRIEYIRSIKVVDEYENTPSIDTNVFTKNFNINDYMKNQTYMYSSDIVTVKFKVYEESGIRSIKDWFGNEAKFIYDDKENITYSYVTAPTQGVTYWALQYADTVEVMEPFELRQKIYSFTKSISTRYENTKSLTKINIENILNDALRTFVSHDNFNFEDNHYIEKVTEYLNNFLYPSYYIKSNGYSLILEPKTNEFRKYRIEFRFLHDKATASKYFDVLKEISLEQDKASSKEYPYYIYIATDKTYYRANKDCELYNHFQSDIKANQNEVIEYNNESIKFKYDVKGHWTFFKKYNNFENKYAIVNILNIN